MTEVKEIRFDEKGNYKNHKYISLTKADKKYEFINKRPGKVWNASTAELEFIFITDNLNTVPEEISEKFIKEKHRLFFYVLDPSKKEVFLEFTKNMESVIDKWLVERKLKKYRVLHELRDENSYLHFGSNVCSFDKLYFVTDEENIDLAKVTLYQELKAQYDELMDEVKFIEKMMLVSDGVSILEKNHKKEVCANIVNQIDNKDEDDEDDIVIEEYVVEANVFIRVFNKLLGWKRGKQDECIQ